MLSKILKSALLLSLTGVLFSCNFEEINTDPNNTTSIEPGALLTYTQMHTINGGNAKNIQVGTCMMIVQQAATLNLDMPGDKYYQMDSYANSMFVDTYSDLIKNWRELVVIASSDPKYENTLGAAKIWGSYLFQRLTDLFGNVPYSEAGLGYYQGIYRPQYDNQEDIYKGMIQEVKEGLNLLGDDKPAMDGDLFYEGNIAQWKKFGGSLLVRLGMRLSEVAPDLAKETVQFAMQNGVMTEAGDMCRLIHNVDKDAFKNILSKRYELDGFVEHDAIKISKTFMDYLKKTDDPRIKIYCSLKDGNDDPAVQAGLPNGYDSNTITEVGDAYVGKENCSNFNTNTILKLDAPTLFLLPSETKLLLAEAALRGWTSGDVASLFKEAVICSMEEQQIAYGVEIPKTAIDAYLAQDLLGKATSTEAKMEVLGQQYWVATFMNGYESYANWRRTGYPVLKPVHYPGNQSNGQIPRRLPYAVEEYTINKVNVEAAIRQQGPDEVITRIWWDKK